MRFLSFLLFGVLSLLSVAFAVLLDVTQLAAAPTLPTPTTTTVPGSCRTWLADDEAGEPDA